MDSLIVNSELDIKENFGKCSGSQGALNRNGTECLWYWRPLISENPEKFIMRWTPHLGTAVAKYTLICGSQQGIIMDIAYNGSDDPFALLVSPNSWSLNRVRFGKKNTAFLEAGLSVEDENSPLHNDVITFAGFHNDAYHVITGPFQVKLHSLDLKSGRSVTTILHANPGCPWLASSGICRWKDGKLLANIRGAGGESEYSTPQTLAEIDLDRKTLNFHQTHPDPQNGFPTPRVLETWFASDGYLVFGGGVDASGDPVFDRPFNEELDDFWILDLTSFQYRKLQTHPFFSGVQRSIEDPSSGCALLLKEDELGIGYQLVWPRRSCLLKELAWTAWVETGPMDEEDTRMICSRTFGAL